MPRKTSSGALPKQLRPAGFAIRTRAQLSDHTKQQLLVLLAEGGHEKDRLRNFRFVAAAFDAAEGVAGNPLQAGGSRHALEPDQRELIRGLAHLMRATRDKLSRLDDQARYLLRTTPLAEPLPGPPYMQPNDHEAALYALTGIVEEKLQAVASEFDPRSRSAEERARGLAKAVTMVYADTYGTAPPSNLSSWFTRFVAHLGHAVGVPCGARIVRAAVIAVKQQPQR